jgi:hypothetical protein
MLSHECLLSEPEDASPTLSPNALLNYAFYNFLHLEVLNSFAS